LNSWKMLFRLILILVLFAF